MKETIKGPARKKIPYTFRKSQRAKHLSLAVYSDSRVVLTAPFWLEEDGAKKFIEKQAGWILKKLNYFKKSGRIIINPGGKRNYKKHKEAARKIIADKIIHFNQSYNLSLGRISVKNQKKRWGSCSRRGNLNFNYRLIFLPPSLAEYVIVHELCHLKELNHSKNFWQLVAENIPDYKTKRKLLKRYQ